MKAPQVVLAFLSLFFLPVQSFQSVLTSRRRIGAPQQPLLKSTRRDGVGSGVGPNTEPILLPPANYSKPGRVVNLVGWAG